MKKLLFLLAFTFIGGEAFSQMYMVLIQDSDIANCSIYDLTLTTISPAGDINSNCIPNSENNANSGLLAVNQELNSIMNQGYKLIHIDYGYSSTSYGSSNGLQDGDNMRSGSTFYLAVPWTAVGLEEVSMTLNNLRISPNPAVDNVDISLSYELKEGSEVVIISESGYIYHKQHIGNISKNEKYNIDVSNIPAGKYLITIINRNTYTKPQKLIVL